MAVNDIVMGAAGASGTATFVEDVFSTWLYAGNGSTQTITNGIDLSGKGGLVWQKNRTSGSTNNILIDTARGNDNAIFSNSVSSTSSGYSAVLTSFNSNGFSLSNTYSILNVSGQNYASWTFREQPKFFDIVTYTGNGANRTIAHNLGSAPGCMIVKRTDVSSNWQVYHNGLTSAAYSIQLNLTNAQASATTVWNSTAPTSSVFSLGTDATVNASGGTYVAYLFAHNAGGFGATGTDNVISCGSFTTSSSGVIDVNLGYEPQYILYKSSSDATNWNIIDSMRGLNVTQGVNLYADASAAESTSPYPVQPTATGFKAGPTPLSPLVYSSTYIYIAIRRPMKTPTIGTEVFSPITSAISSGKLTTGFPVDLQWVTARTYASGTYDIDRLRGVSTNTAASARVLTTQTTGVEIANTDAALGWDNTGYQVPIQWAGNSTSYWNFKRAPGFFDIVCYTGTGALRTINHNLGVAPELMIIKLRDFAGGDWIVYPNDRTKYTFLNADYGQFASGVYWNSTAPTSSVFTVSSSGNVNELNKQLVAYLFATCPGVSKVGSYTGTGATLNINAGFTTGARFVMIKRADVGGGFTSIGNWFVWDTARGMVAGTDPKLAMNVNAAESNANWVYTTSTGFQIVTTDASVNASGGTYIYLAIA